MKKILTAFLSFLLVFSLFLPVIGESPSTVALIRPADEEIIANYTPIVNSGNAYPLYAFTGTDENTAFRVFGQQGSEKGFYGAVLTKLEEKAEGAIELKALDNSPVYFSIDIDTSAFLSDGPEAFGKGTPAVPQGEQVNSGYQKVNGKESLFNYKDLFNQTQYRAWASFSAKAPALYPADMNGNIEDGALALVQANDLQAKLQGDTYQFTQAFAKGWHREVFLTINGEDVIGLVDYPALSTAQKVQTTATAPKKASTSSGSNSGSQTTQSGGGLQVGSKGDRVYALTDALTQLGYLGAPTKTFDEKVKAAVVQFQKDYGIKANGIAGSTTIDKLNYLLNTAPAEIIYPRVIGSNATLKGAIAKQFIGSSEVFGSAEAASRNAAKGSASSGGFTRGKEAAGIFKATDSAPAIAAALKGKTPGLENSAYIDVGVYDFYLNADHEEKDIISSSVVIRGRDSNYD